MECSRHFLLIVAFVFISVGMEAQEELDVDAFPEYKITRSWYEYPQKEFYKGDSIRVILLPELPVYPPLKFKSKKEYMRYNKLVKNVKRTLPIAKLIRYTIEETYEYLETLPTEREKQAHIKKVEKGIKKQYGPQMKKLTYSQGKLLIKLVDRECNQSSYEIVRAFFGPLKAGFYQAFARMFGASLKKEYDGEADDKMVERVVRLVEAGAI